MPIDIARAIYLAFLEAVNLVYMNQVPWFQSRLKEAGLTQDDRIVCICFSYFCLY